MNADALKQVTTDALDTLAHLLDHGHSESLTALLKSMGRFHQYSWHNVCLITRQRPTATRVAGFHTWRSLRRYVRQGEKGIAILAPMVARQDRDADDISNVLGFRVAYVFDVAQTDGEPLPRASEASGHPGDKTASLKAAIHDHGIDLAYADDLSGALGVSSGGRIQILSSLPPAAEFMTLVHEFAHELLHRGADRPAACTTRELEAEAVAFVVGTSIGIDTSAASCDYIQLYGGDRDALIQSLERIQRTASAVLRKLTGAPVG